eukprot:4032238-Pyramimonas_sp.AAC.1
MSSVRCDARKRLRPFDGLPLRACASTRGRECMGAGGGFRGAGVEFGGAEGGFGGLCRIRWASAMRLHEHTRMRAASA